MAPNSLPVRLSLGRVESLPEVLAKTEASLDEKYPVPPNTRTRGSRYIAAFRIWAYDGVRDATKIAPLVGLRAEQLRKIRVKDKWMDWERGIHERETAQRLGIAEDATLTAILPLNAEAVLKAERQNRAETCTVIQAEISAILKAMTGCADKGSKAYAVLVASLRSLRDELDTLLGIGSITKAREAGAIQREKQKAMREGAGSDGKGGKAIHAATSTSTMNQDAIDIAATVLPMPAMPTMPCEPCSTETTE